ITDAQHDTVLHEECQITVRNGRRVVVEHAVVAPRKDDELRAIRSRGHGWDISRVDDPTAQTNLAQLLGNHGSRFRAKMHNQHLGIISRSPGEPVNARHLCHAGPPTYNPLWYECVFAILGLRDPHPSPLPVGEGTEEGITIDNRLAYLVQGQPYASTSRSLRHLPAHEMHRNQAGE